MYTKLDFVCEFHLHDVGHRGARHKPGVQALKVTRALRDDSVAILNALRLI